MKRQVVWIVLVVLAALIEATWLGLIRIGDVVPDLVLLLVVYFAVQQSAERAIMTGVLGGTFQDVAADTGLGHHVLCLAIIGYTVALLTRRLITDNPFVKTGLVVGACLLHGLLYIAITYLQNPDMSAFNSILVSLVPRTLYTALATPFVFFIMNRVTPDNLAVLRGEH